MKKPIYFIKIVKPEFNGYLADDNIVVDDVYGAIPFNYAYEAHNHMGKKDSKWESKDYVVEKFYVEDKISA